MQRLGHEQIVFLISYKVIVMKDFAKQPTFLSLEGTNAQPTSIRAKALVFADPVSQQLLSYIERIAPSEAPVLIIGETGTGKELVARHIHHLSGRRGPFLAVNCGAISDQLAESELFGHEAGSFTGAVGRREGWFEAANEGTLFLDEIGDLPLALQVKLLRVLQEREVVRIGSRRPIAVNVRLVAATNVDLDKAVEVGHFRRDLLYRINIAQAFLPPLRERNGDVLPLAQYFLKTYSKRMGYKEPSLSLAAIEALTDYGWPGNIRELENVIHFALLVAGDNQIRPEHLKVTGGWSNGRSAISVMNSQHDDPLVIIAEQLKKLFNQKPDDLLTQLEQLIVNESFKYCHENQVHTASLLGITRNVMRTLLKRHGLLHETSYHRQDQWASDEEYIAANHL